jgi:lysophospholipase L1-like esterase
MGPRSSLKNTILIVVSIVLALVTLEGSYRAYKLFRYGMVDYPDVLSVGYFKRDSVYGMVPKESFSSKNIDQRLKQSSNVGNFDKAVTFNRWGYRGKDFAIEKPKGTLRIVAFGESTTLGLENDDPDTWPAQLEMMLEKDREFLRAHQAEHVEVINAGVGGWRSREGLLRLEREVTQLSPDIILVAFNWNDFIDGLNGIDPESVKSKEPPWWSASTVMQNLRIRFLKWKYADEKLYRKWVEQLEPSQPWVTTFKRNILSMHAIAVDLGAEFILVNLPGLCRESGLSKDEYTLIVDKTRVKAASFVFFSRLKDFVTQQLQGMARANDIRMIDASGYFERFSGQRRFELFTDEMHTTDLGAHEIARAIYLDIQKAHSGGSDTREALIGGNRDARRAFVSQK